MENKTAVDDVAVKDVVIYVSVSNWVLSPALADVAQRLDALHHAFSRNLRLRLQKHSQHLLFANDVVPS